MRFKIIFRKSAYKIKYNLCINCNLGGKKMQVPLYFLNKDEVKKINELIDIQKEISSESEDIITDLSQKQIIKKLLKREYLNVEELMNVCSTVVLTVVGMDNVYNIDNMDMVELKYILLKLLSSHFDKIDDENFVNNMIMFKYMYKTINNSIDFMKLNKKEKYTYNYLKLLQI